MQNFETNLLHIKKKNTIDTLINKIAIGNILEIANCLPNQFVDLLILSPPSLLNTNPQITCLEKNDLDQYATSLHHLLSIILHTLKNTATIYICTDWQTSTPTHLVAKQFFQIQNRITYQLQKTIPSPNWNSAHQDIWFCTKSKNFTFNTQQIKMKKKVVAPYKKNGKPKDWLETKSGNFRNTHPSNFWLNPYHSEKPQNPIEKLILASSNETDLLFYPCLDSPTPCLIAKKLGRKYLGLLPNKP